MRLGVVGLEGRGALERVDRLGESPVFLQHAPKIHGRRKVVRCQRQGPPQQLLRIVEAPGAESHQPQQAQRIDVVGIVAKNPAINPFRLLQLPLLLQPGGQRQGLAFWVEFEGLLEGLVGVPTPAQHRQGFAKRKIRCIQLGIQIRRLFEKLHRLLRPALLH